MSGPATGRPSGRAIAFAAVIGAAAIATSRVASWFIAARFPDRPMPRDLLLDALPYVKASQYVADAAVLLAMTALAVHLWRAAPRELPGVVTVFALAYLLRAALIVLTPLASPHGGGAFGFMPPQVGMFPSGHSANAMLCVLLVRTDRSRAFKAVVFSLAVAEWVALLLSRGHYSIDIAGGLLLAYFVWAEWTRGRLFDPLKHLTGWPDAEARA